MTYTLTAQYNFTDDVMTYLTYSTGTKSGGFNAAPLAPGVPGEFDAETSDSIELGLKSTLLDGRMTLNVDVYRLNLKDFQDAVVNPNGSGFIVGNAGDRRAQGLELDARYVPFEDFTLGMSLPTSTRNTPSIPMASAISARFPTAPSRTRATTRARLLSTALSGWAA